MMRRIAMVAAAAALVTSVHWILVQPAVVAIEKVQATMFAFMLTKITSDSQAFVAGYRFWVAALLVAFVLVSGSLAIIIHLKAAPTNANRRLSLALGLGSWGAIFLGLMPFYQGYFSALHWNAGPWWQFLLQFTAYASLFCATVFFAQFFLYYPQAPADAQWERHFTLLRDEARAALRVGWRSRLYRGTVERMEREAVAEGQTSKSKLTRHFLEGHLGYKNQFKPIAFYRSSKAIALMLVLAVACAGLDAWAFCDADAGCFKPEWINIARACVTFAAFMAMEYAVLTAFLGLQFHRRNASLDDRARIDWIYSTLLVSGLMLAAIPPLWWSSMFFVLPRLQDDSTSIPVSILFAGPIPIGLELLFLALTISIALSIFYRGTVDPRLAARKITVFWVVGMLLAFLLILIERFLALKVVDLLGLPRETGILVAGAAVAASLRPVHAKTETVVNRFVGRYLPLDSLVAGERKRQAIVMSDLSGYTALSAHDEKQALLLATLLQRTAERLCMEHAGRLVKSMGDAVMLTFDSASNAAAVIGKLHMQFREAAKTLGLEPLSVHSGAHVGEVTETGDHDLYGQTVNIAARLQGQAPAGQCLVSETFVAEAGLAASDWSTIGPLQLKNVGEPVPAATLRMPA